MLEEIRMNNEIIARYVQNEKEIYNRAISDFEKALLRRDVVDKSVVRRVAVQLKSNGFDGNKNNIL